ncbi:carboxypeptidase-like regulatory domain-containing protein [Arthrospiribacter ruber]|uniref:Carboxypeptidase regulatory-like domain-containing protein n=1 Tax=Arthrospiribacter ruber TaxID=2487934 RepID=A0A951J0Z7_9BACT|nr:carboxypeptidase-like regulatory domain-containing protein [Arthrospiribacter ruber]MBW3469979.1 hypothetical protein [Arthrospiribacter ruber]
MKYFPILIFLLCSSLISKAQTNTILGQVIDADTGEPLGFCNVGWVNLSKGTVSDQVGRFRLEMGPENSDHLLKISKFEKSLFRINLYQLLENETYDLLPQNGEILHELTQEMGSILEVDLTPYEIIVNGKYLIGLEWVSYENQVNSGILTISTSYPFGKTLMKNSSHDKWEEIKGAPSIQVDGALLIQD